MAQLMPARVRPVRYSTGRPLMCWVCVTTVADNLNRIGPVPVVISRFASIAPNMSRDEAGHVVNRVECSSSNALFPHHSSESHTCPSSAESRQTSTSDPFRECPAGPWDECRVVSPANSPANSPLIQRWKPVPETTSRTKQAPWGATSFTYSHSVQDTAAIMAEAAINQM